MTVQVGRLPLLHPNLVLNVKALSSAACIIGVLQLCSARLGAAGLDPAHPPDASRGTSGTSYLASLVSSARGANAKRSSCLNFSEAVLHWVLSCIAARYAHRTRDRWRYFGDAGRWCRSWQHPDCCDRFLTAFPYWNSRYSHTWPEFLPSIWQRLQWGM